MTTYLNFHRTAIAFSCGAIALFCVTNAVANDFPTIDRVRFVQECMALENSQKYETLYACSCTLDKIAEEMSYDEFVAADSYQRARNMRGERGGLFRNSDDRARTTRENFSDVTARAEADCFSLQSRPKSNSTQPTASSDDLDEN